VKLININDVKTKLLQDLCDRKLHKDEHVGEYLDEIKQCMISKKVLMVVDDVNMTKNLGDLQLLNEKHGINVDYKSKILLNCRNWQILKNHVREIRKNRHGILGQRTSKGTFHVPCI
jgi:hypothetical protein